MKTKRQAIKTTTTNTPASQSVNRPKKAPDISRFSVRSDGAVTWPITVGMIDELEQSIAQVRALKSMMLSRIFHPDEGLKFSGMEESGLVRLCEASFERVDKAVKSLCPKVKI